MAMGNDAWGRNFRTPRVDVHKFAMIPRAEIPRSSFRMVHQHKTTINGGVLYPIYIQEVLPGDSFKVQMTAFCRMGTAIAPILDNMQLESFFFFVPNRLTWFNWYKFMGEQDNPADSISYTIPTITSPTGGFGQFTIYDYMGLPVAGQTAAGQTITVNALPFRCYNLIFNQWFRDENLQNSAVFGSAGGVSMGGGAAMDNGPDPAAQYALLLPNKRHDYFTSCLPWTQKGGTPVLPLAGQATVKTSVTDLWNTGASNEALHLLESGTNTAPPANIVYGSGNTGTTSKLTLGTTGDGGATAIVYPSNLYADLTTATATTINALRLAFQTQKLLERDARGGTRYTEIIRSHFGVMSPDARLNRPEILGLGKTPINITAVPQTVPNTLSSGSTNPPQGTLSGIGTATLHGHGFRQSFTEHGYILGLICVRTDEQYQQGLRRLWSRSTRYDFYFPVFAMLGEQAVLNKEIYSDGSANDALTFGFQEHWAEYRWHPSYTTGYFRSTTASPLDFWHLATKYTALPTLNSTFIQSPLSTTLNRTLALGALSNQQQFLCDLYFEELTARTMPMYSVPGLIDHF